MKPNVYTMRAITPVKVISEALAGTTYNGFPIVDKDKKLIGMITRDYLIVLLKNHVFSSVKPGETETR